MANPSPASYRNELASLLNQVHAGEPVPCGSVTFVPLFRRPGAAEVDADLLEEGIRTGVSAVTELNEAGSVNSIRVEHRGKFPLLIIDGEQVVGAKQNRVFNASFLVPPESSVVVPVSCVERGRWHYQPRASAPRAGQRLASDFSSSETTLTGTGRSRKLARVARSAMTGRGYDANQGQVWRDVDAYLEKTHVTSHTASYQDGFTARASHVDEAMAAMRPEPGQVGIAAVAGDRLISMDLFGSTRLYHRAWKKVVRGVLADVYDEGHRRGDPKAVVEGALRSSGGVRLQMQKAPGAGETMHVATDTVAVGAVALAGHVYHAFFTAV